MSDTAPSDFAAHLRPGEALLWHGAPRADLRLKPTRNDVTAGLWGVVATALMVLFSWAVGGFEVFPALRVVVIVPLAALLVLSLYPLLLKHRLMMASLRRTRYGLSNQRVLVQTGVRHPYLFSLDLRPDTQITLSEGTIPFLSFANWPEDTHKESVPETLDFLYLRDAHSPYQIARDILQELT